MKKDFKVIFFLGLLATLVYFKAFNVFFAQDDFILINQFSQNSFLIDLTNVFGPPKVTHWRPLHNLYFLITGNVFGKNYFGYHATTVLFHIISAYFVYKTCLRLLNNRSASFFASLIYAINPIHFVSLNWISGNSVLIAFLFFIISFYLYIKKRRFAIIFYFLSLLASESFFFACGLFFIWDYLFERKIIKTSLVFVLVSIIFVVVKFLFLTPVSTFETYQLNVSFNVVWAVKYYLLRIIGFAESSGDLIATLTLALVFLFVCYSLLKNLRSRKNVVIFSLVVVIAGLFPFILLKDHFSPHYMNLSAFGYSLLGAQAYLNSRRKVSMILMLVFVIVYFYSVNLTYSNNWVIRRANIAKQYIIKIESQNIETGGNIEFSDNEGISSSMDAYIALGTGSGIDFWFKGKNYMTCFEFLKNCDAN